MDGSELGIREEFRTLVKEAVEEGLSRLEPLLEKDHYLGTYYGWPTMSHHPNGLPSFVETTFSGPTDYSRAFGKEEADIPYEELKAFQKLLRFGNEQELIVERLSHPGFTKLDDPKQKKWAAFLVNHSILGVPTSLIDRYVHTQGTCHFLNDAFDEIYEPFDRGIFEPSLELEVCVPILFLGFEFDTFTLPTGTKVERMSDDFQLARAQISAYGPGVHKSVLAAATHMLVLEDYRAKSANRWQLSELLSEVTAYPIAKINTFFAALRISAGLQTGYAQLLARPFEWALRYKAHLPPVEGTSIRAYPSRFEDYYWLTETIPMLDSSSIANVGSLFESLLSATENRIRVATRRLNRCYLREEDEDSVLDATIGLEALLSDGTNQEMTHKLAMRVAALATIPGATPRSPVDVFHDIKKIYGYRSAVVHGNTKAAEKKKTIQMSSDNPVPTSELAMDYLRMALRILSFHPEYRKPSAIDRALLSLGSLPV